MGVVAVDPTSPFTGGAILGDRVRMQAHAGDAGVFIRSMATRGHLGGLARATSDAAIVLDAAGCDVVIIETVGVGQDEVDIVRTADVSIVVLVPGTGDEVQALKAGIMEIADMFVVNKADREGADRTVSGDRGDAQLAAPARRTGEPPVRARRKRRPATGVPELLAGDRAVPEAMPVGAAEQRRRAAKRIPASRDPGCAVHGTRRRDARPGCPGGGRRRDQRASPRSATRPPAISSSASRRVQALFLDGTGLRRATDDGVAVDHLGAAWSSCRSATGSSRSTAARCSASCPKPLWARVAPPDDRNRIRMGMRPLLVRGARTMLIDAGIGDKMDAKAADIYAFDRVATLDHALAAAGVTAADIDIVARLTSPLRSRGRFHHARRRRHRAPALPERPLHRPPRRVGGCDASARAESRQLLRRQLRAAARGRACSRSSMTMGRSCPACDVRRTGGHTVHHQLVRIESGGQTAVFMADLIPTAAHVPLAWIMGYDLYPDGHAGVQARLSARGGRARIPGLLRARSGSARRVLREQDGRTRGSVIGR